MCAAEKVPVGTELARYPGAVSTMPPRIQARNVRCDGNEALEVSAQLHCLAGVGAETSSHCICDSEHPCAVVKSRIS